MRVTGIERVVYGVDDLSAAGRFWSDFGLARVRNDAEGLVYATVNGGEVVVRRRDDPALPPAVIDEPTAREIMWGVASDADLEAVASELARDREVTRDAEGAVHTVDPQGYAVAFRTTRLSEPEPSPTEYNAPGRPARIDRRAAVYKQAHPQYIAHIVLLSPRIEEARAFYSDRLGFRLTDSYPGRGYFLRAGGSHEHHNLFLLHVGDNIGLHHLAFEVRDFHELFGGGLYMDGKGWKTHLGPGRHPLSSAYFWYFKNPCGGAAEYDFDSDIVTDAWQPREWPSTPDSFAEWALESGIRRYAGIQTAKV